MNMTSDMEWSGVFLERSELTSLTVATVPVSSFFGQAISADGLSTATLIARLACLIVASRTILCITSWALGGRSRSVGKFLFGCVTQRH